MIGKRKLLKLLEACEEDKTKGNKEKEETKTKENKTIKNVHIHEKNETAINEEIKKERNFSAVLSVWLSSDAYSFAVLLKSELRPVLSRSSNSA